MTYLELVKKLGLTKLIICLMDELGYQNKEIAEKLEITEPTIYNARKSMSVIIVQQDFKMESPKRNKPIITPVEAESYGNADVNKIINMFKESFGTTTASKYDRYAANRLAKKYGADSIVQIIQILAQHSDDMYVPTVNSVLQIEKKWVNVSRFFNNLKQDKAVDL